MNLALRKQPEGVAERRAAEPSLVIVGPSHVHELGTHHGRRYVTVDHPQLAGVEFELLVDQPVLDLIPGTAYVDAGRDTYIALRRLTPGSYERLAHPQQRTKRKPETPSRVSLLDRIPLFAARRPEYRAIPGPGAGPADSILGADKLLKSKGRAAARGWQAVEARFTDLGALVVVPPEPYPATLAGRVFEGAEEVWEKVAAWIAAGRRGRPWPCAWCEREATDLLVGPVPACEEHAA